MTRPGRECVEVGPLLTAREGELTREEIALRDRHLAGCDTCRSIAAAFAATEGMVGEALERAAARRDFAPFVDAVMERVEARRSPWSRVVRWARAHRAAALAGTLAPSLAALALIVYFSTSATPAPRAGEVEVVAEGRAATVLQTRDGPVVLLGDDTDGT